MHFIPSPAISVLMPVFNTEAYLEAAIESILQQTFQDFEFLLLNDGSTDGSLNILKRYEAQDDRVKLINRENRGIARTRNELLEHARGEYVVWMDSDDVSLPERLRLLHQHLTGHPEVVACGTAAYIIDPEGFPLTTWRNPLTHDEIDGAHIEGEVGRISFPTSMMLTKAVRQAGAFREELTVAEDLDLLLRIAENGLLSNLSAPLYCYRQHHSSVMRSDAVRNRKDTMNAVNTARRRRGFPELPPHQFGTSKTAGRDDTERTWAWWALKDGYISTARKHAWRAFRARPWKRDNLTALVCALRGR
jgi:glycosyltransferase involved in cell wall biosynthesis